MIRRVRTFLAVALAAASAMVVAGGSNAGAAPTFSGRLTMTSDEGDFIGEGDSYSFPGRALRLGATRDGVTVSVLTHIPWSMRFEAPSAPDGRVQRLRKGVYENAQRFADVLHPGLNVSGDGRGCNESTGRFTVLAVEYGPLGYVRSFHATFEQHCEGGDPALRGEVRIKSSPPPAPLKLKLSLDASRTSLRGGGVRIEGTLACTQLVDNAGLTAELSEAFTGGAAGSGDISLPRCGPEPTRWKMTVASSSGIPFTAARVRVLLSAAATDTFYADYREYGGAVSMSLPSRDVSVAGGSSTAASSDADGSSANASSDSGQPTWTLVVALAIVAAVGWTLGVAEWLRRRTTRSRSA